MKRYSDAPVISGIVIALAAIMMMAVVLCGCSRKTIPQVVTETHTTLQTDSLTHFISQLIKQTNSQREKETVYVFDRTTEKATVNEKGDTIGFEKDHERMTSREHELECKVERLEHELDSLSRAKNRVDSVDRPVPYPVEVVKEVPRKMSWWETVLVWMGFGLVVFSAWKVYKLYKS